MEQTASTYCNWENVLRLAIPMLCIVAIIWLFLRYSRPSKEQPANVHILYISGYAVLIIIALIDYICTKDQEYNSLINMISFGATLSSLIMSVVAIIFTIVSGKNDENQLGKITQATHELQETAQKLTEFSSIAESIKSELKPSLDKLDAKLNDVDNHLKANSQKFEENYSMTSEIKETLAIQKEKTQTLEKDEQNGGHLSCTQAKAIDLVEHGSFLGNMALLACCYSKDKDKAWNVEAMGNTFKDNSLQYVYGYLIASTCVEVISFVGQFPQITCTNYESKIKDKLLLQITEFIKGIKNSQLKTDTIKEVNTMQEYFGINPTRFD